MARKARERALSGVYYVEASGNNRVVFIEDDDYRRFIERMTLCAAEDFAEICAYALDSEKVCLVIKEGLGGISAFMHRLLPNYVSFYNAKYSRSGKLFCDRFKSEPLESDDRILDAVRYVHRLPIKWGKADGLKYVYSSYNSYDKCAESVRGGIVMLLCLDSPQTFRTEMEIPSKFGEEKTKPTDAQVRELLRNYLGDMTPRQAEQMSGERADETVRYLHDNGVSIRRLACLLSVSKSAVERSLKKTEKRK